MPRLTDGTYLDIRHHLMTVWELRSDLLGNLAYFEQRDLHRFFAMSHEMYDDDALAYRREVTRQSSSLPSQAGRAYAKLERVIAEDRARRATPATKTVRAKGSPRLQRVVTVKGIAQPEIDARRVARLLVDLAVQDEKSGGELLRRLKQ